MNFPCTQCTGGQEDSPEEAKTHDAGATLGRGSEADARFVACVCVRMCVYHSFFYHPAGQKSSHCEATYWRAVCQ